MVVITMVTLLSLGIARSLNNENKARIEGVNKSNAEFRLELKIPSEETKTFQIPYSTGDSVFSAIESYAMENESFNFGYEEFSFDKFITKLDGIEASDSQTWEFYVNDMASSLSTTQHTIQAGDVIRFNLVDLPIN